MRKNSITLTEGVTSFELLKCGKQQNSLQHLFTIIPMPKKRFIAFIIGGQFNVSYKEKCS